MKSAVRILIGGWMALLAACSAAEPARNGGGGGGGGSDTGATGDAGGSGDSGVDPADTALDSGEDTGLDTTVDTGEDTGPACGDGVAQGAELCDGSDLRNQTCTALGFDGGALGCLDSCAGFDVSACEGTCVPDCRGRACGPDPVCATDCGTCGEGETCTAVGQCLVEVPDPVCGNGLRESGELCDGADVGGQLCTSFGYDRGTLGCAASCQSFDFAACESDVPVEAVCGNGTRETGELCDGADVGTQACTNFGFDRGTLACSTDCGSYDFGACVNDVPTAVCGNGVREPGELCDTNDVGSQTCLVFGFDRGALVCTSDCLGYNFDGCENDPPPAVCGNGAREGAEVCDGADLAGASCTSLGYDRGALTCQADCAAYITTGCSSDCLPNCGGRACGPDPVCGISCGTCAGDQACNASGACEATGPRGPRFINFNSNVTRITQGETVTFTVVVTDPDGIDDVIGGTLQDPVSGRSYGSFATSASEGAYSVTLDWFAIHRVRDITFTGTTETRVFEAEFYDVAGNSATSSLSVTLSCNGLGVCDAICTDLTTTLNCGTCGTTCAAFGSCTAGACTCPTNHGVCSDVCVDLTTDTDCGSCGNACGAGGSCGGTDCVCDAGYRTCGTSGCRSLFSVDACQTACTACSASQTCSATGCGAAVDGSIRMRGDTDVLEVFHTGSWLPVCDDSFDAAGAEVACRQLGGSLASFSVGTFTGTTSFWLDDVNCAGTEASITDCVHSAWGTHNCNSSEGVSLRCTPGVTPICPSVPAAPPVINEVLYDPTGVDGTGTSEFVELFGTPGAALDHWSLVFYDGTSGTEYLRWSLDGAVVPDTGYFVVGGSSTPANLFQTGPIQNGPDSVRLEWCNGSLADALAYGVFSAAQFPLGEGSPVAAPPQGSSAARAFDGADFNDNATDFIAATPSPGAPNFTASELTFPYTIRGNLSAADPSYTRVAESASVAGTCGTALTSGSYYYETYTLTNTSTTTYSMTATATWTADGYLFAYQGSFTPSIPNSGCLYADDDGSSTSESVFSVPIFAPGDTLVFVMTTYSPAAPLSYTLTLTSP